MKEPVTKSSGNVFRDLGLTGAEAEEEVAYGHFPSLIDMAAIIRYF